jgi:hypothetical protein
MVTECGGEVSVFKEAGDTFEAIALMLNTIVNVCR